MFRQNPSSFPQHDVHLGLCDTSRGQVPPQPLNDATRIQKGDGPMLKMRLCLTRNPQYIVMIITIIMLIGMINNNSDDNSDDNNNHDNNHDKQTRHAFDVDP